MPAPTIVPLITTIPPSTGGNTSVNTAVDPEPLEIAPWDNWGFTECLNGVTGRLPKNYGVRYDYAVLHDHLRNGEEWVGPGLPTDPEMHKQFVADDFIADALNNLSNAFLEPQMGTAPLQEVPEGEEIPATTAARMREAEALLTWWWDQRKIHEGTLDRLRTAAWNGYAVARPWIPSRYLLRQGTEVRVRPTNDNQKAISYIHISLPEPTSAAVVTHVNTQDQCAIFIDEQVVGEQRYRRAELVYLDPRREEDENAVTIQRVVYEDSSRQGYRIEMPLGGRLLSSEMQTKSLLTEPVLRTQRQLNFISTMLTRMTETGGFRERYIGNSKPHGKRVLVKDEMNLDLPSGAHLERDEEERLWAVIPEPRGLGSKMTTELVGLDTYDPATGKPIGHESPVVKLAEPVNPTPYVLAAESVRRRGLRMCSQGHLAQTSTAEASGFAYEQSRATFANDLNARRLAEEGMLRDLLTQVLALVEYITGKPGYFTKYIRITIDQRVDPGPRSPDAVRLEMEGYEKGLISQETMMSRLQIEDIVAEVNRLRSSPITIFALLEKAMALVDKFGPDAVLRVLAMMDVPQELLDALQPLETDRPVPGAPSAEPENPKPEETSDGS